MAAAAYQSRSDIFNEYRQQSECYARKRSKTDDVVNLEVMLPDNAPASYADRAVLWYRMKPEFLSRNFKQVLEENGLRQIRFHDLRHSSASLLLANHVPLKQIQEWLGHSDFSTTANIYAHLDAAAKKETAAAMLRGLGFGETEDSNPK